MERIKKLFVALVISVVTAGAIAIAASPAHADTRNSAATTETVQTDDPETYGVSLCMNYIEIRYGEVTPAQTLICIGAAATGLPGIPVCIGALVVTGVRARHAAGACALAVVPEG